MPLADSEKKTSCLAPLPILVIPIIHIDYGWLYTYIPLYQWEFQDPKMKVLYHIRPYFVGIFTYIGLI